MGFNDNADDVQSQPQPLLSLLGGFAAEETLPDQDLLLLRNADTRIGDRDPHLSGGTADPQSHAPPAMGILDGIIDEVSDGSRQPDAVPLDTDTLTGVLKEEVDPLLLGDHGVDIHHLLNQGAEVKGLDIQLHEPALHLAGVHQVLELEFGPVASLDNIGQGIADVGGQLVIPPQGQLRTPPDPGQRGPEIVGNMVHGFPQGANQLGVFLCHDREKRPQGIEFRDHALHGGCPVLKGPGIDDPTHGCRNVVDRTKRDHHHKESGQRGNSGGEQGKDDQHLGEHAFLVGLEEGTLPDLEKTAVMRPDGLNLDRPVKGGQIVLFNSRFRDFPGDPEAVDPPLRNIDFLRPGHGILDPAEAVDNPEDKEGRGRIALHGHRFSQHIPAAVLVQEFHQLLALGGDILEVKPTVRLCNHPTERKIAQNCKKKVDDQIA